MFRDFGLDYSPVVKIGGRDTPHVVLKLTLAHRTAWVSFIGAQLLSKITARLKCSIVDRFKNLFV